MSLRSISGSVGFKTSSRRGTCHGDDMVHLWDNDSLSNSTAEDQPTQTTSNTQQAVDGIDGKISEKTDKKRTSFGTVTVLGSNVERRSNHNSRTGSSLSSAGQHRLYNNNKRRNIKTMDVESSTESLEINECMQREEKEEEGLRQELLAHANDKLFLKNKLHTLARKGNGKKLKTICTYLKEAGYSLLDDDMLGKEHKETALVVAIIKHNTEGAKILIEHGGSELVSHRYTAKQYENVTPLHLAIMKKNHKLVDCMLETKMDDDTKKEFIHSAITPRNSNDGNFRQWTPLSLAVAVGSSRITETLLNNGADLLEKTEDEGNTILHLLCTIAVRQSEDAKNLLDELMKCNIKETLWWKKKFQNSEHVTNPWQIFFREKNKSGFTPMSYAVSLGAGEFAEKILQLDEVYRFSQSHLGLVPTYQYDVTEIDPAVPGRDNKVMSVLELYAYTDTDQILDFGGIPHMSCVIENKWRVYWKWFVAFFIYHLLVMVTFTISCVHFDSPPPVNGTFQANTNSPLPKWKAHLADFLKYFVLFSAVFYLILDIYDLMKAIKKYIICILHRKFTKRQVRICLLLQKDIMRLVLVIFSLSVIVMHTHDSDVAVFGAMALFSGWMFMFFFIRALKNGGMFTAIMRQVMTREVFNFLLVFFIGLIASGTALRHLLITEVTDDKEDISSLLQTLYSLFEVMVGLNDITIPEDAKQLWLIRIIFVVFITFCHILMLNILIAALNNAYHRLHEMKYQLWLQSCTKAILFIERRLPPCLRPDHGFEKLQQNVNKKMGPEYNGIDDLWVLEKEDTSQLMTNFGVDDDVISIQAM